MPRHRPGPICRGFGNRAPVIRSLTPRLAAYAALAAAGLLASLLLGRPEAVLLALPFALIAVVGLALASEPVVSVVCRLDRSRVLVGAA